MGNHTIMPKPLKPCAPGKERNPATNRCRKKPTVKSKPAKPKLKSKSKPKPKTKAPPKTQSGQDNLVERYGGHSLKTLNDHLDAMMKDGSKGGGTTKLKKLQKIQNNNGLDTLPLNPKKGLTHQRHHQLWQKRKDKSQTWEAYKKLHKVRKQGK
jgi:hypothetical protein